MQRFGFWREEGPNNPRVPSIHDWVLGKGPLPDFDRVGDYLSRACQIVWTTTGGFTDLVTGEFVPVPHGLLTNRQWEWPTSLAHYVRNRSVGLPSALLTSIRSASYEPPVFSDEEERSLVEAFHDRRLGGSSAITPESRGEFLNLLERLHGSIDPEDEAGARCLLEESDAPGAWTLLWTGVSVSGRPIPPSLLEALRDLGWEVGSNVDAEASASPIAVTPSL